MKKIKLQRSPSSEHGDKDDGEVFRLTEGSTPDDRSEENENSSSSPTADSPELSPQSHNGEQAQQSLSQHHLHNHHTPQHQRSPSPTQHKQQQQQQQHQPANQQSTQPQQSQQPQQINQISIQRALPGAPANFCNICNKELCNKYFMKTHMQKMHGINLDDYPREAANSGGVVCDICQKELCSKYFLKVHKSNTHGISDFSSGPAGTQAASAATAVAAIALTNSLNNAQKRAALNLALNQHQLQSRQAAALMNVAAASAAFNPLQIQAAKVAALQQQPQEIHHRDRISQANSVIGQLQSQPQQFDQQHLSSSQSPLNFNPIHQSTLPTSDISPHPSPTSTSSPSSIPVTGLNMTSFPAALLAATAAASNQTLLSNQLKTSQENPFPPYGSIGNSIPSIHTQLERQQNPFISTEENLESEDDASDRDSLIEHQSDQNKNHSALDHIQQQLQNQQAILNAVAFNPTAATAAMVALQQQQQQQQNSQEPHNLNHLQNHQQPQQQSQTQQQPQQQSQPQQPSILGSGLRQNTAMDLRNPSNLNQLLIQQMVSSQRSQHLLNTCVAVPSNLDDVAPYRETHQFLQPNVQTQQRQSQQKQRSQRRRAAASQRTSVKRELPEEEDDSGIERERSTLDLPNALITLAMQQAQQAAASRQSISDGLQNCTTNNHTNSNGSVQTNSSNSSRYLRHYTEACPICDRRFKSIKWLQSHVMNDHKNEIGNLFNLLVQVLLCGNAAGGANNNINNANTNIISNNSNTGIGNNLVNVPRSGAFMAQADDTTSTNTGNNLINSMMSASSLTTPIEQHPPPIPGAQGGDLASLGGLSSTLASLIGLQQQIQTLQANAATQQHQRLGMVLPQASLSGSAQQQALSSPTIASLASANNRGNI